LNVFAGPVLKAKHVKFTLEISLISLLSYLPKKRERKRKEKLAFFRFLTQVRIWAHFCPKFSVKGFFYLEKSTD